MSDLPLRLRAWERIFPCDDDKPEGSLYLEAADRIEELETLIKDFFILLDKKEENDGGRVFRPNQIYSCRVQDKERLDNLLRLMKAAVEFKNA